MLRARLIARAFRRVFALSSWRFSNWQPVLSDLKNSSIVHRARSQSTANAMASGVSIGRSVSRNHSTVGSPRGAFRSKTWITFTRSDDHREARDGRVSQRIG